VFLAFFAPLYWKINVAFKYVGSGRNLALDGSFLVDDVQNFESNNIMAIIEITIFAIILKLKS
jgi:hypothetical protein